MVFSGAAVLALVSVRVFVLVGMPEGCLPEFELRLLFEVLRGGGGGGGHGPDGPTAFCSCSKLQVARFFCALHSKPQFSDLDITRGSLCVEG